MRATAAQSQESGRALVGGAGSRLDRYLRSGEPYIWATAAAISLAFLITAGLLLLLVSRGLPHFWPAELVQAVYAVPGQAPQPLLVEIRDHEAVTTRRLQDAGLPVAATQPSYERLLVKTGNRELGGVDFRYLLADWLQQRSLPADASVFERLEWGNFHGYVLALKRDGQVVASGEQAWVEYQALQQRIDALRAQRRALEKGAIASVNGQLERLRLAMRHLELEGRTAQDSPGAFAPLMQRREQQQAQYQSLRAQLAALDAEMARETLLVRAVSGQQRELPLATLLRGYRPNGMSFTGKLRFLGAKLVEFVSTEPRESNTEGGIFPAIFGTVLMVILMSVIVTPFGILAALYLHEYARQGALTRTIRIAVNNLAGVPSIVFGMFGLGFFVYFVGGQLDQWFYREGLPSPTFGTPGILWASLTLALLTLPVVIVATEEGLSRIPGSLREASMALGATQAETLLKIVLPIASPAMMTGLILAVARAAGEVAPLMLVGVIKLAPTLPIDGSFPFLHLERKFMHLGFHIYDVGFQSPNVEAARPLVYATSLLLVAVILSLNLAAIAVRSRLRERFRMLDH